MEQPAQWGLMDDQIYRTCGSDTESNTIHSYAYTPYSNAINTQRAEIQQLHQQQRGPGIDCVSGSFNPQSTTSIQTEPSSSNSQEVTAPFDFVHNTLDGNNNFTSTHLDLLPDFALPTADPVLLSSDHFDIWNPQFIQEGIDFVGSGIWTSNNAVNSAYRPWNEVPDSQNCLLQGPILGLDSSNTASTMLNTDFAPLNDLAIFEGE